MAMFNKRNVTLAILSLLMLVVIALLIGNFTYSYVAPDISDDISNKGEVTATGDTLIFSSGNKLALQATTDNFNATSGNLSDTTNPSVRLIASSKTNNASASYYAGIKISENTYTYSTEEQNAEVLLLVRDETGGIVSTSADGNLTYKTVTDGKGNEVSGFDITGKVGTFNIVANHAINTTSSTNGTTHTWEFTLVFVNYTYDQSINETANIAMDVVLQRDELKSSLAEHIKGLYTSDGENDLYYHDGIGSYENANQEAGDNSYRYAGANPNNYVCFGTDASTCPVDNLYRIIGVFDGQVKLIKNISIGSYYWSGSGLNNNIWSDSILNTNTLNGTYLDGLESKWSNLLATTTWKVGGMSYNGSNTAKQYYNTELGISSSSTTYSAKIGLMYVSDYGYAASPENWNTSLYGYDNDTNRNNNWMYLGSAEWTISRISDFTKDTFLVLNTGGVSGGSTYDGNLDVRPSFYLESTVVLSGGSGTAADPYRIV